MKTLLSLSIIAFLTLGINAQSISTSAFTSAGGSFSNMEFSIEYAVGEVISGAISDNESVILTQGVIQPEGYVVLNVEETIPVSQDVISFYPNPFINNINVKLKDINEKSIDVKLIDITGKIRYQEDFDLDSGTKLIEIDTEELKSGIYFITVSSKEKLIKRAKLYKK